MVDNAVTGRRRAPEGRSERSLTMHRAILALSDLAIIVPPALAVDILGAELQVAGGL